MYKSRRVRADQTDEVELVIKRKRRKPLKFKVAIAKIEEIARHVGDDIEDALLNMSVMEAGNDLINAAPQRTYPGAKSYSAIQHALTISVLLTVARLFDQDGPHRDPNKSDKASLPSLMRLLSQKRCAEEFAKRARSWIPHMPDISDSQEAACRQALSGAIFSYRTFRKSTSYRNALKRVRELRDREIAHSLTRPPREALPIYRELFDLLKISKSIVRLARFAIEGSNFDYDDVERIMRNDGDRFWRMALLGTGGENISDPQLDQYAH